MKIRLFMILLFLMLFLTACGKVENIELSSQKLFEESSCVDTENQRLETSLVDLQGKNEGQNESQTEIKTEDIKPDKGALTLDQLIEVCSDEKWAKEIEEQGIGYFLHYDNFELEQGDGSTWEYKAILPYGNRFYEILVIHSWPHNFSQKFPTDNPVDYIFLQEKEFGDTIFLYSRSEEEYEIPNILDFLAREYHDINYYLTFELPEGISLGGHKLDMNLNYAGSYFEGERFSHNDQANDYFCKIGGIGVTEEELTNSVLVFEEGNLVDATHSSNHGGRYGEWEKIENEDMCAIIADYDYDRFTGLQMQEYEEEFGVSLANSDKTCEYWYVFMGNEGEERSYHAFFHKNAFSKEEVIEFIKSIRVK